MSQTRYPIIPTCSVWIYAVPLQHSACRRHVTAQRVGEVACLQHACLPLAHSHRPGGQAQTAPHPTLTYGVNRRVCLRHIRFTRCSGCKVRRATIHTSSSALASIYVVHGHSTCRRHVIPVSPHAVWGPKPCYYSTLRAGGTLLLLSSREQLLYFVQLHEGFHRCEPVDVQTDNQILHF